MALDKQAKGAITLWFVVLPCVLLGLFGSSWLVYWLIWGK